MRGESRMDDKNLLNIGHAVKKLREKKGWTQGDLCRATGYERSYISLIERNGVKYPRYKTISRLSKALGVSINEFLKLAICGD